MKIKDSLVLSIFLTLVSCAGVGNIDPVEGKYTRLHAVCPNEDSVRTGCDGLTPYWNVGDRIGVCIVDGADNVPFTAEIASPSVSAPFRGEKRKSGTYFSYSPYREGGRNGNKLDMTVYALQHPSADSFDGASDILASDTFDISENVSMVPELNFHRLTAVLRIELKDNTGNAAITGLELDSMKVTFQKALAGNVVLDGSNATLSPLVGEGTKTLTAVFAKGSGSIVGSGAVCFCTLPVSFELNSAVLVEAWSGPVSIRKAGVILDSSFSLRAAQVSTITVGIGDGNVTLSAPTFALSADPSQEVFPQATVTVNSLQQFNALGLGGEVAKAGTVVVIKDGTYSNFRAVVNAYGTLASPLVIRAETPGGVKFTGSSYFNVGGSYVHLLGFEFKNQDIPNHPVSFFIQTAPATVGCRISNCKFNYDGVSLVSDPDISIVDIRLFGKRHKVEFCSFMDKKMLGPQLAVQPCDSPAKELKDTIRYCYFTRPSVVWSGSSVLNGQESILAGLSKYSQKDQYLVISRNYFYKSDGEHSEVISNKGCNNKIEENCFVDCWGNLSLRHGKYNIVRHNFLYRTDQSLQRVNGVCVYDGPNTVDENVMSNLPNNTGFAPVSIQAGNVAPDRSETDAEILKAFWKVAGITVRGNVVVSCNSGFTINNGYSASSRSYKPESMVFENNILCGCVNPVYNVTTSDVSSHMSPDQYSWKANWFCGGSFLNDVSNLKINNFQYSVPSEQYSLQMARILKTSGVQW